VSAGPGDAVLDAAAGAVELRGGVVAAARDGTVRAHGSGLAVDEGAFVSAGRDLRLDAAGDVLIANSDVSAQSLVVRAGPAGGDTGTVRLDAARFVLGTGALFAAGGGITAGALSTVAPYDPSVLPALLFDTRRGGAALTAIPGFVQPDQPGLAPEAQATQVRLADADAPGAFGAASANPAGVVQLHLDAGASPVFLLLDGGSASGGLAAGRLGVHGRGGSVELAGAIAGRQDETAALAPAADITRPIPSEEHQRYRFNGCIIGSASCDAPVDPQEEVPLSRVPVLPDVVAEVGAEASTATSNITRLFLPPPVLHRLSRPRSRLADPDIVLPNTTEDDY